MKTILFLGNRYCATEDDLKNILSESRNHTEKSFRNEVLASFKDKVMHHWCAERGLDFGLDNIDLKDSDDDIFKSIVAAVTGRKVTADITSSFNEVGELIRVDCCGKMYDLTDTININSMNAKTISFVFRSKKPENNKFKFTFAGQTKIIDWNDKTAHQEVSVEFTRPKKGEEFKLIEGKKNEFGIVVKFVSDLTVQVNGVSFVMKFVEGGSFRMGSDYSKEEKPIHAVTLDDFYIGETQVTQMLWNAIMMSNPSDYNRGNGSNYPVNNVSWLDCNYFIEQLNKKTKMTFRLPTEAEWEYAARGGVNNVNHQYSGSDNIGTVAWYSGNSGDKTHPVRLKLSNELGIYDMSGNVYEWCYDRFAENYYSNSPKDNPRGPASGRYRVLRGGSWCHDSDLCRVSGRYYNTQDRRLSNYGFRLLLSSLEKEEI